MISRESTALNMRLLAAVRGLLCGYESSGSDCQEALNEYRHRHTRKSHDPRRHEGLISKLPDQEAFKGPEGAARPTFSEPKRG